MAKPKTEFSINQIVVYPSQGVGEVTDVFKKDFKGKQVYYYKIHIPVSDMNIMVPVDNAANMGIRSVVNKEQAEKAIELLGQEFDPPTSDWKLRYQQNIDLLHSGTVEDIAAIVRCLYHRSKIKELPAMERKLYESAKKLLEDELSYALGKSAKEVETLLHAKLEPLGAKIEKKSSNYYEDDDDDEEFNEDAGRRDDSDSDEDEEEESEDMDEGEE
ncbi:MAG: CarD family transcriptional regulator [Treponema sp.]|nr:CarD family transcriptional regulator [Treponema sp.]